MIIVLVRLFLRISPQRRVFMGMTKDGLSYWQADSGGIDLLDTTLGDLLDSRANEIPGREAVVYSCYPEFGGALDIRKNCWRWYCPKKVKRSASRNCATSAKNAS